MTTVRDKTAIITMWYNEAMIAPFFLKHYRYVDEIHVILDTDTNDNTLEICEKAKNVRLHSFTFPDGFSDPLKQQEINRMFLTMDCDWVYALDADEFIFTPFVNNVRMGEVTGNLMYARMWQVYRCKDDKDLSLDGSIVYQRRHGDPDLTGFNANWVKPIVVKPETGIQWRLGCHSYLPNPAVIPCSADHEYFMGAHWAMADPDLAVVRRLQSKKRQSPSNISSGYQAHNHNITEQEIRRICKQHEQDPRLF